jgi:flagellar P-ring protein precursor FlgI
VIITATVPAAGAQQGDRLNCVVNAVSAKSLKGGTLMISYLRGPRADDARVYALAQGPVSTPDPAIATSGVVYGGCKMESTIKNEFAAEDKITLILDQDLASFSTTVDIADAINGLNQSGLSGGMSASNSFVIAQAIDQLHVEVEIPPGYRDDPIKFIPLIQELPLTNIRKPKRVVLNEREGVIIIGEDVLINPVVVSHESLSIEARSGKSSFVGFDPDSPTEPRPKLKNLVDALNALKVPTSDVIAIIRGLDRNGDLYGEVIID